MTYCSIGLRQVVEQIISQQERSEQQLRMTVTEIASRNMKQEVKQETNLRQVVGEIAKNQAGGYPIQSHTHLTIHPVPSTQSGT